MSVKRSDYVPTFISTVGEMKKHNVQPLKKFFKLFKQADDQLEVNIYTHTHGNQEHYTFDIGLIVSNIKLDYSFFGEQCVLKSVDSITFPLYHDAEYIRTHWLYNFFAQDFLFFQTSWLTKDQTQSIADLIKAGDLVLANELFKSQSKDER